jgi:MFS superfamily sulfate permease-like transporter
MAAMNRAFYIIFVPVLLVMIGYILVFRAMGLSLGYPRMVVAILVFTATIWWIGGKVSKKADSSRR